VFENRMLRRIFGPKRDEVTGDWRTLHKEDLITVLFAKQNDQVKKCEMGRACSTNMAKRNAYRILVGDPEGRRPLGRQRRRWVDSFKMDRRQIGEGGMDCIDLAQDRDQ
jgi:hypothetical protein